MTRPARGSAIGRVLLGLAAGAALLGATVAWALWPYRGYAGAEVTVEVPHGASASEVARVLAGAGVIRSAAVFRWVCRVDGGAGKLQAGEYRFSGTPTPFEVRDRLLRGDVVRHRVTIPEGLTADETTHLLAAQGCASEAELRAAVRRSDLVADLDPAATDLEGYLFPDTYEFARGIPAEAIVARMAQRFHEVLGPAERRRAAASGRSIREVVILASLVEEETARAGERALVASVYCNRLARGMLLQCDPTVLYALARAGRPRAPLRREDLAFPSPYNTYLHPGLPPGPITNPGAASLRAALDPFPSAYLYFVADGGGGHSFSRTLPEHHLAVERYRRSQATR